MAHAQVYVFLNTFQLRMYLQTYLKRTLLWYFFFNLYQKSNGDKIERFHYYEWYMYTGPVCVTVLEATLIKLSNGDTHFMYYLKKTAYLHFQPEDIITVTSRRDWTLIVASFAF